MAAAWVPYPLGVRVYAVDYDAGSDAAALGYVDATDITDAAITTAMVAAGAAPLKTWEELMLRVPPDGAGRAVIVAIKNRAGGATYLKKDGVTIQDLELFGHPGFVQILLLATSDFSNSAADKVASGGVVDRAGPNGDGSWTVNATGTTSSLSIAGSPNFPADPACLLRRVRFPANTPTVALQNATTSVSDDTATTLTLAENLPAAPQAGDKFFIERPGVVFGTVRLNCASPVLARGIASGAAGTWRVSSSAGMVVAIQPAVEVSFCADDGSGFPPLIGGVPYLVARSTYQDLAGTTYRTGAGFRSATGWHIKYVSRLIMDCSGGVGILGVGVGLGHNLFFIEVPFGMAGPGCVFWGDPANSPRIDFDAVGVSAISGGRTADDWGMFSTPFRFGTGQLSGSFRRCRVAAMACIRASSFIWDGVTVTNAGVGSESGAISVRCEYGEMRLRDVDGSAGNAAYGISLGRARGCRLILTNVSVTGLSGDIITYDAPRLNAIAVKYLDLAIGNVIDEQQSFLQDSELAVVNGQAHSFLNVDGTALAAGEVVRVSAADSVVRAQADSPAHAKGPLWVSVTSPANNARGLFVPLAAAMKWVLHNAAPALPGTSYLHTVAGQASTTVPASDSPGGRQKRRLGQVARVSGSFGLITGSPELLAATSDGLPD